MSVQIVAEDREVAVASKSMSILVVDDDPSIRIMLRAALAREHYDVQTVPDGGEAIGSVLTSCPDVILLDLMMPGVDGWKFLDALHDLRASGAVQNNPCIIVISAYLRANPQDVLKRGAHALLPKPFDLPNLMSLIQNQTALLRSVS